MPICVFDVAADGTTSVPTDRNLTGPGRYRWWHYDMTDPDFADWVHQHLPSIPAGALLQSETRPRCDRFNDGLILNLRGINMNTGSQADEMISLRMWAADDVIITVRRRKVFAIDLIRQRCGADRAPLTTAAFLETLIAGLTDRVETHIDTIEKLTDHYETDLEDLTTPPPRDLPETRRSIIRLRRYLEPQRTALAKLAAVDIPILPEPNALQLRELANRSTIAVEELDELRDRLISVQDEHDTNVAQRQARHSYVLSVAAAIFLPLSFITGLFGVNLNGMIGAESPYAFAVLCLSMVALAVGMVAVLRWVRWL
ncbi:Magnesium transporter, CorA family protein [Sulfitobacter noctilucae]|uniref:zinc transporter ZntB n=1 Tax=Sulfitobacter noctilucae TaxID=1342302 RepID=UPI0004685C14|nr:zinc transporter ZntB [Sulfitobacter noctilucae]KIN65460.1 Magnesium transporter, CorA family protein [Sulfitobacter noctilucae]